MEKKSSDLGEDETRPFEAHSAGGSALWTARFANSPRADTEFWGDAVFSRLERRFDRVERSRTGDFEVVRASTGGEHLDYVVALRVSGDALELVEAHFPNPDEEDRHAEHTLAALAAS